MALAVLQREVAIAERAIRGTVQHGVGAPLGKRVARASRRNVIDYFDRLERAIPQEEIVILWARSQATNKPAAWQHDRIISEALRIVDPVVESMSADLMDAIFGPNLFAWYAGSLRFTIEQKRARRIMRRRRRNFSDALVAEWSDNSHVTLREASIVGGAAQDVLGNIRPDVAAWLSAQAAPVTTVANDIAARAARSVTAMDSTSKQRLANIIARGVEKGQDVPQLARAIKGEFADMKITRARLIALNETNESMSRGADDRAVQQGAAEKGWLTVGDDRVTDGCLENEGQGWIEMNDAHASGHMRPPRFPGCRCAEGYRGGESVPMPSQAPPIQPITPKVLDAALNRVVGRLPGVTYKSGLSLPPKEIAAIGRAITTPVAAPVVSLPPTIKPVAEPIPKRKPPPITVKPEATVNERSAMRRKQDDFGKWKKVDAALPANKALKTKGVNRFGTMGFSQKEGVDVANELGGWLAELENKAPNLMSKMQVSKRLQEVTISKLSTVEVRRRSGDLGVYAPGSAIITQGSKGGFGYGNLRTRWTRKIDPNTGAIISRERLGGAYSATTQTAHSTFTHEFGHHAQKLLDPVEARKWAKLFEGTETAWWGKNVSEYAMTNASEAFAESFSGFVHPKYKAGMLPVQVERFMKRNIK